MVKKQKIAKKRKIQYKRDVLTHAKIIIGFFVMSTPILFLLILLYPLTILSLFPPHPCFEYVGTEPSYVWNVPTTAYSSTVDQTDSTPFITADGTRVRWGVVAANFLPFNTCIRFPEMFGEQWFIVHDRKHKRFSQSIDIWHPTRAQAKYYGFKLLKTEIW